MKGAFVIFCAMVVIGVVLYLTDIFYYKKRRGTAIKEPVGNNPSFREQDAAIESTHDGEVCCGMHTVCEKTNLSPITADIIYYDDEELDRFKHRSSGNYTPEEAEEFREIMMTMKTEEVAGWSVSLQLRGIELPDDVREELLMIVSDLRNSNV